MWVYIWDKLPSEYQEVEYIQSSWTQYFKVGASFSTNYKTVVDLQMTNVTQDYIPFWVKKTSWGYTYKYWVNAYSWDFYISAGSTSRTTFSADTNRHTITIDKNTVVIDGTSSTINYVNFTYNDWLWVFYYNTDATDYLYSSNKLYKLDIYDENWVHIYDLVPCYRKSDSVIGMYDLVNDVFYTNAGTGTFTKWSDVNNYYEKEMKNAYIGEVWTPWANTIAYYPLKEDTNDYSGNNRNLTNTWITFAGWVWNFDGSHCAWRTWTEQLNAWYTVSFIAKCTNATNVWIAFDLRNDNYEQWQGMLLGRFYQSSIWFYQQKSSSSEEIYSTTLDNNEHHWVVTWTGSVWTIYKDGSQIKQSTINNSINTSASTLWIGSRHSHGSDYFVWTIREVIIENTPRTQTDIDNYRANYWL